MLDGTVRVHINFPAGTLETFEPVSDTIRLPVTYLPGGIDRFFAEVGEPATSRELPPPLETPPDLERLAAIGEQYGMQIQVPEGT